MCCIVERWCRDEGYGRDWSIVWVPPPGIDVDWLREHSYSGGMMAVPRQRMGLPVDLHTTQAAAAQRVRRAITVGLLASPTIPLAAKAVMV